MHLRSTFSPRRQTKGTFDVGVPDLKTLHKNNVRNTTKHQPWRLFLVHREPTGWQKHKPYDLVQWPTCHFYIITMTIYLIKSINFARLYNCLAHSGVGSFFFFLTLEWLSVYSRFRGNEVIFFKCESLKPSALQSVNKNEGTFRTWSQVYSYEWD